VLVPSKVINFEEEQNEVLLCVIDRQEYLVCLVVKVNEIAVVEMLGKT